MPHGDGLASYPLLTPSPGSAHSGRAPGSGSRFQTQIIGDFQLKGIISLQKQRSKHGE